MGLLDGAFVDWIGLFEGMTDGERVTVLLDLFIRKVRVALEGDFLRRLSRRQFPSSRQVMSSTHLNCGSVRNAL